MKTMTKYLLGMYMMTDIIYIITKHFVNDFLYTTVTVTVTVTVTEMT